MICYFFSGVEYIRVSRGETGPGSVNPGYPASLSVWGWGNFGKNGIDASLFSGSKCYFFSGDQYIRVTRGVTGPGTVDPGYPKSISVWGWGAFGANGIDAALYSGSKCYFFSGNQYIRVTRGDTGPGTVDPGYPKPVSVWGWGNFGKDGIDAALFSGTKCYFFAGREYIRVTRGDTGPGTVDPGYPLPISNWGWHAFGKKGIDAALYSGADLSFTMQQQSQSNWCWAAVSSSVSHYYDSASTWTQCRVANTQLGRSDCCGSGASGACNVYGYLDQGLQEVGHLDHYTGSVTGYEDLRNEIIAGRPLGIRVAWSGGGAHFIAAIGAEGGDMVLVGDPGSGSTSLVDYDTLKTSYSGSGTWTHSYFTD